MHKGILNNTIFYVVASMLPVASNFILLPFYTHYISTEGYGILGFIVLYQSFLPLVLSFQLQSSLSRFYFSYKGRELKKFITTLLLTIIGIGLISGSLVLLNLDDIIQLAFPSLEDQGREFTLATFTSFFTVINLFQLLLLRVEKKAKLFASLALIAVTFNIITSVVLVIVLERSYTGVVEAALINVVFSVLLYSYVNRKNFVPKVDFKLMREPIYYSLPLVPHSLSGLIFMYSDRIILERYVSLAIIGIYAFADKISTLFKLFVNEVNNAYFPYFNEAAIESAVKAKKLARELSKLIVYIVVMLISVATLFSPEVVYLFFDNGYFEAWKFIPILASAYLFRSLYMFASSGIFFIKKTSRVMVITLVAGTINLVLNLYFIPIYGIWAAALSTLLSFIITYIMAVLLSIKVFYIQLDIKFILPMIGFLALVVVSGWMLNKGATVSQPFVSSASYLAKLGILMLGLGWGYGILNLQKIKGILAWKKPS